VLDQGVGDRLADVLADGDRQLVFQRPVADHLDEVVVPEHRALDEDRVGHLDGVVGDQVDQLFRRVRRGGDVLADLLADRHLDIADDAMEDVEHEGTFPGGQYLGFRRKKIGHRRCQRGSAFHRFLPGEAIEILDIQVVLSGHSSDAFCS